MICYADDILVLVEDRNTDIVMEVARDLLSRVLDNIRQTGLRISPAKTEAVLFGHRGQPKPVLRLDDFDITFSNGMKYLGVIVDSRWSFEPHLKYVADKVSHVGGALCGLMPNLRDPGEARRRLYLNTLISIIMYAVPVWSDKLSSSKRKQTMISRACVCLHCAPSRRIGRSPRRPLFSLRGFLLCILRLRFLDVFTNSLPNSGHGRSLIPMPLGTLAYGREPVSDAHGRLMFAARASQAHELGMQSSKTSTSGLIGGPASSHLG